MAQYRLGQYELAQETLRAALSGNDSGSDSETADLTQRYAFLSMAQLRLGDVAGAKRHLDQARTLTRSGTSAKEAATILAEAEALSISPSSREPVSQP